MPKFKKIEVQAKLKNDQKRLEIVKEQKAKATNPSDKAYWESRKKETESRIRQLSYALKRMGNADSVEIPSSALY